MVKLAICQRQSGSAEDSELASGLVLAGLEDGNVALIDLKSSFTDPLKPYVQASSWGKALSAIATCPYADGYRVATGTIDGQVSIFALANTEGNLEVVGSFKRNNADITSLLFSASEDEGHFNLIVGTADGLPFQLSICEGGSLGGVQAELAGYDIDACTSVQQYGGETYTAGMDGSVRRY